ncbi:cache domain-containing protein [Undibacterium seohonense]|jgi:methyl-accepting chemotaxis protein|uniref:Cache domain-containing protein n=1 Tax=Undibacterium seohonense TaxID=1344950 RepID=A0ABR6X3H0_9BURK|nr:methyl-accepting chemotaxis protein [Undibacterium seohonense]MBC3807223.1 cache domain-containing protein [Undibacterium seohonense]
MSLFDRWFNKSKSASKIADINDALQMVALGDLSRSVTGTGIGLSFNTMVTSLSNKVAQIRNHATIVGIAGESLANGTKDLAERTQLQAKNLSVASLEVDQNLSRAQANEQAATKAQQSSKAMRQVAESGEILMHEAVEQIRKIELSSKEMSEIIAVIDSIAFQTNILALNAAVEAARAGEQGRGFAVVASEVRSLAQRSASSASQIKNLIAQSTELVATGVTRIEKVGDALHDIVTNVRELTQQIDVIAQESLAQSEGLARIATSVKSADELTQKNAEMVEESVRFASAIDERSRLLSESAQAIRLQQGSADEARAMVKKAVTLIERRGLESAVQQFLDKQSDFFDRDMYVFIFNRKGIFTAFGPNPSLTGKHLRLVQGLQWELLLADGFACIDQGSGWVDYQTIHPVTGSVNEKVSYVEALAGDLLIGCGVYKIA